MFVNANPYAALETDDNLVNVTEQQPLSHFSSTTSVDPKIQNQIQEVLDYAQLINKGRATKDRLQNKIQNINQFCAKYQSLQGKNSNRPQFKTLISLKNVLENALKSSQTSTLSDISLQKNSSNKLQLIVKQARLSQICTPTSIHRPTTESKIDEILTTTKEVITNVEKLDEYNEKKDIKIQKPNASMKMRKVWWIKNHPKIIFFAVAVIGIYLFCHKLSSLRD